MKTLLIAVLTIVLSFHTNESFAQVVKTNTTQGVYNGTSDSKIINFNLSDFGSSITSIDKVTIEIEFASQDSGTFGLTFHEDIAFRLVSPSGTEVDLVYDARGVFTGDTSQTVTYGGNDPTSIVTVNFDDTATQSVFNVNPISGTFRPVEPLSVFNNESPIGDWTLLVADSYDNGFDDQLFFFSYSLSITPNTLNVSTIESEKISIYPTLIEDTIAIKNLETSNTYIEIMSLNGKNILNLSADQNTYNLSQLKSGVYILRIISENKTINKRIIKL